MDLKIVRLEGNLIRIDALGKVTRDGWPTGREPIAELFGDDIYRNTVLLNLGQCSYLDSTGVEWLLVSHKRFSEGGGKLIVHSAKPMMQQILKMMRMDLVLNLAADEERAREIANGSVHESSNT